MSKGLKFYFYSCCKITKTYGGKNALIYDLRFMILDLRFNEGFLGGKGGWGYQIIKKVQNGGFEVLSKIHFGNFSENGFLRFCPKYILGFFQKVTF
jgi:hypothetical protein